MSKPQQHRSTKAIVNLTGDRVTPVTKLPASQRVEAPPCTSCKSDNTFIYTTRGVLRYCKCRHCGWTYSHSVSVLSATRIDDIQTR